MTTVAIAHTVTWSRFLPGERTMTRKDYVKLAGALMGSCPVFTADADPDVTRARVRQHRACIKAIADVLAGDNGRFDRERFYRAAWFDANSKILPAVR